MYDPSIFASLGDIYSETYSNSGTIIKREVIKLPRNPSSLNLNFGSGILSPTKFFIFRGDVYIFDKSKFQPQKRLVGNYDYDVFFGDKTTNQLFLVNKSN